jgi:hypothetical protein
VVYRNPRGILVAACGNRGAPPAGATCLPIIMVGRGRRPLGTLLAPLLAALSALLGAFDGHIKRHLLVAAWGCLPVSLGGIKFGGLHASGIRGGNAAQLLDGVPKNVVVSTVARVPCVAFGSRTSAPLVIPSMRLEFNALALLPQRGPRSEVSSWRLCHPYCGWPLPIGSGLNQARSWVKLVPAEAIC